MIGSLKRTVVHSANRAQESIACRVSELAGSQQLGSVLAYGLAVQPQVGEKMGLFQSALDTFVTGEGLFNDLIVTAGEVAKEKLRGFGGCLKNAARLAIQTGLAVVAPVALGLVTPALFIGGARQLAGGIKEKNALAGIQGGRKMLLAGEVGALATQIAPRVAGATLSRIAAVAVLPMAVAQIALDAAQGAFQIVHGAKAKDKHTVTNGVSDLAMATALTVGLAAGPAAALPIACAALTLKVVNGISKSKYEKERQESRVTTQVPPNPDPDFTRTIDLTDYSDP